MGSRRIRPRRHGGVGGVLLTLMLLGACSSAVDIASEEPVSQPESRRSPTVTAAVPAPGPTPTAPPAAVEGAFAAAVDLEAKLWFAKGPGADAPLVEVERALSLPAGADSADQLDAIMTAWLAGPTAAEAADGFSDSFRYAYFSESCVDRHTVELVDRVAVVTLCVSAVDGYDVLDARRLAAFDNIIESSGLVDEAALLFADGDRCVGLGADASDLLACLPAEFHRPEDQAVRCPIGRTKSAAVVTGVDEWVNSRTGPSTAAPVIEQVPAGSFIIVYPSTLVTDVGDQWWITAELPGKGRCAYVAARFLTGTHGNMGDIVPGVDYVLPTSGSWTLLERDSALEEAVWALEGAFSTTISLRVLDGARIDDRLERQLEQFEEHDYDYPSDWFEEVEVDGADRAVRPVAIVSLSGDIGRNELMVEIDGLTLVAETGVYIEDARTAPIAEMETFLNSITIDRPSFLDSFRAHSGSRQDLFGRDFLVIEEITSAVYTEAAACGPTYEYFTVSNTGERRRAGRLLTESVAEVADRHVIWDLNCEGGDTVSFGVARVTDSGAIQHRGYVSAASLGVRSDYGSLTVVSETEVRFEGQAFGSDEIFEDTFSVSDLLANLP